MQLIIGNLTLQQLTNQKSDNQFKRQIFLKKHSAKRRLVYLLFFLEPLNLLTFNVVLQNDEIKMVN